LRFAILLNLKKLQITDFLLPENAKNTKSEKNHQHITTMQKLPTITALLLLTTLLQAQTPAMVKDINPGASSGFSSTESSLVALGNIVYFSANDGSSGSELWRSDGTAAGTYMVKDIQPGSAGSAPIRLSVLGNQVLFFANDGTHGDEL